MKSVVKFFSMVSVGFLAATATAFAQKDPLNNVPEPGSLALAGLAICAAVLVARKGKK